MLRWTQKEEETMGKKSDDKNPDLRKEYKDLTQEQRDRESQEHEDGAPARHDDGTPVGETS